MSLIKSTKLQKLKCGGSPLHSAQRQVTLTYKLSWGVGYPNNFELLSWPRWTKFHERSTWTSINYKTTKAIHYVCLSVKRFRRCVDERAKGLAM